MWRTRTDTSIGHRRGRVALAVAVLLAAAVAMAAPSGGQAARSGAALVRLPFPRDDGSLTPYSFQLGYPLVTLIYDTLLWRDDDGIPKPWLARSVDVATDGRRVTVHLAEGARWHDGVPLTADDVVFTFGYVAEHPHPRFTAELRAVQRVDAPDPATVVITLRQPSPGFLDQPLADLPILPAHLWRNLGAGVSTPPGLPVGSGPYRLTEYAPDQRYRFEAVADYFRGRPAVDAIEVPIIHEAGASLRALQRRDVDALPTSLPQTDAELVNGLGVRLLEGPSYLGTVVMFNLRQAPFDRIEVRQALSAAIDLNRIVGQIGDAVPADRGYLHPESPWAPGDVLHIFDAGAARAALSTMALAPLEVLAPDNDPVKLEAARQVALAWRRVGLSAEAKVVPRPDYARAVGDDGSTPSFGVAVASSEPLASYDPDLLRRVFGSDVQDATLNVTGYRSAAFDAAAARIATTTDPVARRAAVLDGLRVLASDAPAVPLFFGRGTFAYRPAAYDGWRFVKGSGILDKRSFVEPRTTPPAPTTTRPLTSRPPAAPALNPPVEHGGGFQLGFLALGCLAAAVILAGVALFRRF